MIVATRASMLPPIERSRSQHGRSTQKPRTPRKPGAKKSPPLPTPTVLLDATQTPDVVTIPARVALAYDGAGAPEGDAFQKAVGALYGIGYTLKFARKHAGGHEFKIGPLEGRWWAALEGPKFVEAPRESWRWRLRIAVPDDVTEAEVAETIRIATKKKGGKLEASTEAKRVFLERIPEQSVGRALHVGAFAEEGRTFEAIAKELAKSGIEPAHTHIEVYLSDPRKTPPSRLKTVLLCETR
jgi:hypothetical protein